MKLRAFVLAMCAASTAAAEGPVRKKDYALQTLAVDGGTLVTAALTEEPAVLAAGFVLGPPIVHLAHRQPLNAAMSLVLRITAPLVLAFAARAADGDEDAMVWGALGGAIVASTVDAVALAREPPATQAGAAIAGITVSF